MNIYTFQNVTNFPHAHKYGTSAVGEALRCSQRLPTTSFQIRPHTNRWKNRKLATGLDRHSFFGWGGGSSYRQKESYFHRLSHCYKWMTYSCKKKKKKKKRKQSTLLVRHSRHFRHIQNDYYLLVHGSFTIFLFGITKQSSSQYSL